MTNFQNKFFCLFGDCVPVTDSQKCALYFLNDNRIEILPLDVYKLIEELKVNTIDTVASQYQGSNQIYDWIKYLQENGIGFITSDNSGFCYPEIQPSISPSFVKRVQLEYSYISNYDLSEVAKALEELHCKHMEIRLWGETMGSEYVSSLLKNFKDSCIRSIVLYIESKTFNSEDAKRIIENNKKIYRIVICDTNELSQSQDILTTKLTLQYLSKRKWPLDRLMINRPMFSEAFHHNVFYHDKLAIDQSGFIRNDLLLQETYSKFDRWTDICKIVRSKHFRRFWDVSPNKIEELKDNALKYAIYPARKLIIVDGKYHIEM